MLYEAIHSSAVQTVRLAHDRVVNAYHPKTTSQQQKGSGVPVAVERLDCI